MVIRVPPPVFHEEDGREALGQKKQALLGVAGYFWNSRSQMNHPVHLAEGLPIENCAEATRLGEGDILTIVGKDSDMSKFRASKQVP